MKHLFALAVAVIVCTAPAAAQTNAPQIIAFAQSNAAVSPAERTRLDAFAVSVATGDGSLIINGHADPSEANSVDLSNRRAGAVRDYLVSRGVSASRITAHAYGSERPATGRPPQHRRVEITVGPSSGW